MPLLKRTLFNVDIAGQSFKIAALTLREFQRIAKDEKAAVEAKNYDLLQALRCKTVALALTNAGTDTVNEDDVANNLSVLVLNSLYASVLEANGLKLEPKLGEAEASPSS